MHQNRQTQRKFLKKERCSRTAILEMGYVALPKTQPDPDLYSEIPGSASDNNNILIIVTKFV